MEKKKQILVLGGGGFIGGYLVKSFLESGHSVRVVDIKPISNWFQVFDECENHSLNMEIKLNCYNMVKGVDEIYNLACNMGGMGFIENNNGGVDENPRRLLIV